MRNGLRRGPAKEHHFGVLRGEQPSAIRGASLEQHRRALRAGLGQVGIRHGKPASLMANRVNFGRVGIHARLTVASYRIVFP